MMTEGQRMTQYRQADATENHPHEKEGLADNMISFLSHTSARKGWNQYSPNLAGAPYILMQDVIIALKITHLNNTCSNITLTVTLIFQLHFFNTYMSSADIFITPTHNACCLPSAIIAYELQIRKTVLLTIAEK